MKITFDASEEQLKDTVEEMIRELPKEKRDEIAQQALESFIIQTAKEKISNYNSSDLYRVFSNFESQVSNAIKSNPELVEKTNIIIEGLMEELPTIINEAMILFVASILKNNLSRFEMTSSSVVDLRTKLDMISSRLSIY